MRLTVSLVLHGDNPGLLACLESLYLMGDGLSLEIICQDHGAKNLDTKDYPVKTICPGDNPGFGTGHNRSLLNNQADCFMVLNADTQIKAPLKPAIINFLIHQERGLCGGLQFTQDNVLIPSVGYMTSLRQWKQLFSMAPGKDLPGGIFLPGETRERSVGWANGSCMLIRPEAFQKINGFDPNYFLFYEEVDLQQRLKQDGWQVFLEPRLQIQRSVADRSDQLRSYHLESALRFGSRWIKYPSVWQAAHATSCLKAYHRKQIGIRQLFSEWQILLSRR